MVDERGAEGAARSFFDLVVLVCWQPRRPSAGMVDGVLVLLGPKNLSKGGTQEERRRVLCGDEEEAPNEGK